MRGFADYLDGLQTAYAIEVRHPRRIEPISLGFCGPMSYRYLNAEDFAHAPLLTPRQLWRLRTHSRRPLVAAN
jgi:hypothetical protein